MKRKISVLLFFVIFIFSAFAQKKSSKEIKENLKKMKKEIDESYSYIISRSNNEVLLISGCEIIANVITVKSLYDENLYSSETVYCYYKGIIARLKNEEKGMQEFFLKKALDFNPENYQAIMTLMLINEICDSDI